MHPPPKPSYQEEVDALLNFFSKEVIELVIRYFPDISADDSRGIAHAAEVFVKSQRFQDEVCKLIRINLGVE